MKSINICLIKPDNYIHSYAFMELSELIYFSLKDLGCEATLMFNQVEPNAKNILIGCHLLDPKFLDQVPKSTIILNTEQIYSDTTSWNNTIFKWAANFEVWDYSTRNIEKLEEIGVNKAKLFKIGFQKELARFDKSKQKDVDVLFYGSLNEKDPPFTENNPYEPNSPYSASKAASDHLVRAWFHTYGLPILTTNCSNNYGPYHFPEKLIPLCILNALEGKPLPI
jgi:hypothetical protein